MYIYTYSASPRKIPRLQQKKRVCGVVTGTTPKDGTYALYDALSY
jgi:hypothetical protein